MIRLETLVELRCLHSSFSSLSPHRNWTDSSPVERFEATVSQSTVPSPLVSMSLSGTCGPWITPEGNPLDLAIMRTLRRGRSFGHIHLSLSLSIHIYIYMICVSLSLYLYIYTHTYTCVCVYVYIYIYIDVCMYVCMYVYIYIYIYTHVHYIRTYTHYYYYYL